MMFAAGILSLGAMLPRMQPNATVLGCVALALLIVQGVWTTMAINAAAIGLEGDYSQIVNAPKGQACRIYEKFLAEEFPATRAAMFSRMPYVLPTVSELPFYLHLDDSRSIKDYSTGPITFGRGEHIPYTSEFFCSSSSDDLD